MKVFSPTGFKQMPWKNGGGTTIELLRFPLGEDFCFRLSQAHINKDGPFSEFPGKDRQLLILDGDGIMLIHSEGTTELTQSSPAYFFKGETKIESKLLGGAVTDFNVMIDRKWGTAEVERIHFQERSQYHCSAETAFLFCPEEMRLYQLEKSEVIELAPNQQWIIVSVNRFI